MVRGLEHFKTHFAPHSEKYVLIGGVACFIAMEDAGLDFRATKDLDIVLQIEALDHNFVRHFGNLLEPANIRIGRKAPVKISFIDFIRPDKWNTLQCSNYFPEFPIL